MSWLLENVVGIIGILVGGFIAYHVYFLSKKLDLKDKLSHKEAIRKRVIPILDQIRKGSNRESELVNVKKYFTHYPNSNEKNRHGYTYLKGELKNLRYDGVEFFCGVREAYRKPNGNLTLNEGASYTRENFNLYEVGLVPFEWIEYVDTHGDEFSYRPQFFTRFNGTGKYPWEYLVYYKESDTYQEGNDPMEMKWSLVEVEE